MNVEIFRCDHCGRVLFMDPGRGPNLRPSGEPRVPQCGGENLTGYGGGQTHQWSAMSLVGTFTLAKAQG